MMVSLFFSLSLFCILFFLFNSTVSWACLANLVGFD